MEILTEKIDLNNLDKSNWETFKFDEIAQKISKTIDPNETILETYVGLEHIDAEDLHIRRKGTPDDVKGGKLRCYPGDIIFGKRRAYQRKAAIVDFHGICSAHAFVLRANSEVIDPKLFPFFLHSDQFMHRMVDISVGGLSPTINWGDLKHQEFLLPPKDQQAQLAKLLWVMNEVIEREKVVLEKIETHKSTYVKNCIFHFAMETDIPFISIGELFEVKTGNKNAQDAIENGEFPFFTRSIETQRIDTYDYDQEALILPGEGNFQIKYFKGKFNVHQRTYVLSDKGSHSIKLPLYKDVLQYRVVELIQKSVGSTVDSLRKPIIEKIKVPLLSEKDQQRIEGIINKQDNSQSILEEKLSSSKSLQKSLINQIF